MEEPIYLNTQRLPQFLFAQLSHSGLAFEDLHLPLERSMAWYAQLYGQGLEDFPFFLVHDLGNLLVLGGEAPLRVQRWFEAFGRAERAEAIRYGAGFLAPLRDQPWFRQARDLWAESPVPDSVVVFFLKCFAQKLGWTGVGRWTLQPARLRQLGLARMLREVEEIPRPELGARARQQFLLEEDIREQIEPGQDPFRAEFEVALARLSSLGQESVLGPLEWFEMAHLEELESETLRLSARHMKASELLHPSLDPSRISLAREVEEVDTELLDEGTYPSGGLGSLSTRGSWENLVPSELMYMDPSQEIDHFAVRFTEGELLFYTRDSTILRRKHRQLHLFYAPEPSLEIKVPQLPYSLDRLVEGWILAAVRDLFRVLSKESLQLDLWVLEPTPGASTLLSLGLEEEIRRGELRVHSGLEPDLEALRRKPARRHWIWVGAKPPPPELSPQGARESLSHVVLGPLGKGQEGAPGRHPWPVAEDCFQAGLEIRRNLFEDILG